MTRALFRLRFRPFNVFINWVSKHQYSLCSYILVRFLTMRDLLDLWYRDRGRPIKDRYICLLFIYKNVFIFQQITSQMMETASHMSMLESRAIAVRWVCVYSSQCLLLLSCVHTSANNNIETHLLYWCIECLSCVTNSKLSLSAYSNLYILYFSFIFPGRLGNKLLYWHVFIVTSVYSPLARFTNSFLHLLSNGQFDVIPNGFIAFPGYKESREQKKKDLSSP